MNIMASHWNLWTIPINFILLPLLFLLAAVTLLSAAESLEKKLPEDSRLRKWLGKPAGWKNPHWLRDRIDMVVMLLIVIALIGITITYS